MAGINKKLTAAIAATSPEKQKDLAELCKKSAETMSRTSAILLEASEAFKDGNFADGCDLLQRAEDAISKA